MFLKLTALVTAIVGFLVKVKMVYAKLSPLLEPIIKEVEQRAKDGLIDKEDRKQIAMAFIAEAQKQGKIKKFGFFESIVVSKVVDWVAEKLPDFKLTAAALNK